MSRLSKDKGSSWEREVGRLLSLWLTDGDRPDIFSRNVLSGGAFTLATSRGQQSSRMPGDLMAASPLAFEFMAKFLVECKHLQSLGLENYLFDRSGKAPMTQIVKLAEAQAAHSRLDYMIVAKQNRREPLVLVAGHVGERMLAAHGRDAKRVSITPLHHFLHKRRICLMWLNDMVTFVKPQAFLNGG